MALPKLVLQHISKSFPGVKALIDVDFDINKGEIVSLVGENGAGKSTLINVITGQLVPEDGVIIIDGKEVKFSVPKDAINEKIGIVPQELNLVPELSVTENIFLGNKVKKQNLLHSLDWNRMNKEAEMLLGKLDISFKVTATVGNMSVANQQIVQIARALALGADVLIFDEPTACLTSDESERLLNLLKTFAAEGKSIIFVSHHMDEVMKISDRVFVMRDGRKIETLEKDDINIPRMIKGMVGREVAQRDRTYDSYQCEEIMLSVEGLTRDKEFRNMSFDVMKGEIFGIAGLVGAGRTELVSTIFGDRKPKEGKIVFDGIERTAITPDKAIKMGMGYVPEERRHDGILPNLTVDKNITIAIIKKLFKFPKIDTKKENAVVSDYKSKVNIKSAENSLITQLSGGNQQKVILSRWLAVGAKLLILDEPTRGIDVLAKEEIHRIIRDCAAEGVTILVVSSEMDELLNLCNRIMIMHEGNNKGIVNACEMDSEKILSLALA